MNIREIKKENMDFIYDEKEQIDTQTLGELGKLGLHSIVDFLGSNFEIAFNYLKDLQPKSYALIKAQKPKLYLGVQWYSAIPTPWAEKDDFDCCLFFVINNQTISLWPKLTFKNNLNDNSFNFPDVLFNAWLRAGFGWSITQLRPGSDFRQLIGHPESSCCSVEYILGSFTTEKSIYESDIRRIQAKIPDVYTMTSVAQQTPYKWCSLRCFLDTRPFGINGRDGDQFFFNDARTDKVVYHLHDGDTGNIRYIPADAVGPAMDAYCAHTLEGNPTRFDFLPFSELL
ncbi:hypothetical protein LIN78_05150 [Leeia sp. TBRC 13508]|uniref:Uncharacterized protein n=1 Tax=Leeia speluncae TaxID=2884804 RepID=A0ABS8D418_9NEIS|nr:hypothetical protein [Leeia speluncae]MCB6182933.1 hypothetical protein [Leeia speluncae]